MVPLVQALSSQTSLSAASFCFEFGLEIYKALSCTVMAAQVKVMEKYCISHLASSF